MAVLPPASVLCILQILPWTARGIEAMAPRISERERDDNAALFFMRYRIRKNQALFAPFCINAAAHPCGRGGDSVIDRKASLVI